MFDQNLAITKPTVAQTLTAAQIAALSDKDLHAKCQTCGLHIRKLQREFACYLPEVEKRGLHKRHGFHTIYEYAGTLAGMNQPTVDAIMAVHKNLTNKPILKDMIGEFGWGKLKVVAAIATPETQNFWAEKIKEMSKATLVTYLQELRKQEGNEGLMGGETGTLADNPVYNRTGDQADSQVDNRADEPEGSQAAARAGEPGGNQTGNQAGSQPTNQIIFQSPTQPNNYQIDLFTNQNDVSGFRTGSGTPATVSHKSAITFKLDDETETKLRIFKQQLEKKTREPKDWNEVMKELLEIEAQHGKCAKKPRKTTKRSQAEYHNPKPKPDLQSTFNEIKKSLPVVSKRYIPARVKNYLQQKHGGKCAFPSCKYPADTNHHIKRFSLHPNHNPENIVPLCKNHERIAHHGLINHEDRTPENWKIRLEPDKNLPKFAIDKMVQRHRAPI